MAQLVGITPRLYQETILATCSIHNCLTVLPTGLGKTAIAMLLAVQRLSQYPTSKILFLAPTARDKLPKTRATGRDSRALHREHKPEEKSRAMARSDHHREHAARHRE